MISTLGEALDELFADLESAFAPCRVRIVDVLPTVPPSRSRESACETPAAGRVECRRCTLGAPACERHRRAVQHVAETACPRCGSAGRGVDVFTFIPSGGSHD